MNKIPLNIAGLDGGVIIKKGGGSAPSASRWTGHADAEGLKAIGWTDEDIAYYQENGVNWNEEDDDAHKVSDDNKALYGVLTADNISSYKERIVYLPKIDTSGKTSISLRDCTFLEGIPMLDTSAVTSMASMFNGCMFLTTIPPLDTQKVTNMNYMFRGCSSLTTIPPLDTQKVTDMNYMFQSCISLTAIPPLDTPKLFYADYIFSGCSKLTTIPLLDLRKASNIPYTFSACYSLTTLCVKISNLTLSVTSSSRLSKESLLYIINNETATSAITIQLASYAYARLSTDPDIEAALAAHPNISISQ